MRYKMFSEEKLSQTLQKSSKILVKNLFTQTHLTVLNIKGNCISKLSIKMFIKRKTRAERVYAYRMLLNFKTSATDKICL